MKKSKNSLRVHAAVAVNLIICVCSNTNRIRWENIAASVERALKTALKISIEVVRVIDFALGLTFRGFDFKIKAKN